MRSTAAITTVLLLACGGGAPGRDQPDAAAPPPDDAGSIAAADAPVAPDAPSTAEPDAAVACPPPARLDYSCTGPADCAGGLCVRGLCLGPDGDPARWAACGDGACGPCETAEACRADCGEAPARTALPSFDPATTITIKLHGLAVATGGSLEDRVYGGAVAPGALEASLRRFAPDVPDGIEEPTAPDQMVAPEYYGRTPAAWMSPEEVARIEALDPESEDALERYATIVAMFVRHRLATSGATHAAIVCHSMGCHVTRYLVEHDLEGLASEGRIARIVSVAGALGGAGLAELFDHPLVRDYAMLSPIETTDFVHLHPDFVTDRSAIWDHQLREANNPTWAGILLHQITASDPRAGTGLRPLDIVEPNEPNDSVLYARDTYFVSEAEANRVVAQDGTVLPPGHSWAYANHPSIEEHLGAVAIAAAGLWHRRRVRIVLRSVEVIDDRDAVGPAEIAPQVAVRFDPYLADLAMPDLLVHEQRVAHRSADLVRAQQGETTAADLVLFDGPVFDAMTELDLEVELREVDRYARFGVDEALFGDGDRLAYFRGPVALEDGTFTIEGPDARATIEVDVTTIH
jgi:hypothetical protein